MNRETRFNLIIAVAWLAGELCAQAQGTAFTYQGSLSENGERANGIYQVRFTVHGAGSGENVLAGPITNAGVAVVDGLFTTTLDFGGAVFDGNRRWLELGVATNGAENFTELSPRQEILSSPYAIAAARLIGPLPSNGLAGAYSEQVTLSNPANVFAGDGGGLTNVQAATLEGLSRADLWQLGGNSGTSSNSFLGTTDDEPLELRVNGQHALRLQPTAGTPNIIGGFSGNYASGAIGATISGGGANNASNRAVADFSTIGGGSGHAIGGFSNNDLRDNVSATIAGGSANIIRLAPFGTVSGGQSNRLGFTDIFRGAGYSVIGGGCGNVAEGTSCTVGGGLNNQIVGFGFFGGAASTIAGGVGNLISASSSTIGGGEGNTIRTLCEGVTIAGGIRNTITGYRGTIGGGANNTIDGHCSLGYDNLDSTIAGGSDNVITLGSGYFTISGGHGNKVEGSLFNVPFEGATISGGVSNVVVASASTIPGGLQGKASNYGQMAYASGQFAAAGDAQTSVYVCRGSTSDATPTEIFLDGASQRMTMPTNSTWTFDIQVAARASDGTSAAYQILGAARNNGGITTLAAAPKQNILVEDDPSWNAVPFAAAADNKLTIRVTGSAAISVRWVATIRTTEVIY